MKLPAWILMLLLVFAAAAVTGCGSNMDRATYDRITDGMTTDEVRAIAGEPQKQESMSGEHDMGNMKMTDMESWYYPGEKDLIRIDFGNGRVTGKSGF